MAVVLLTVEGTPRPQPRPRLCRGRVVSTADANARRWQSLVYQAARAATLAHGPFEGAVTVCLAFAFPTPQKPRHGLPHLHRPDADNLAKLALDQVVRAGLLKDDAAVSCLIVRKTWADKGGMAATIAQDQRQETPPAEPLEHPRWVN